MLTILFFACSGANESDTKSTSTNTEEDTATTTTEDTNLTIIDDSGTSTSTVDTAAEYQAWQDFYDPTVLHEVVISLTQADLEALEATPDAYVKVNATVEGTLLEEVGLRLKGGKSILTEKPSLKLSLDEYHGKTSFGQMSSLYLDAMNDDDSESQQVIAAWLWNKAGMIAPKASFATVNLIVDGDSANPVYLGVYANLEVMNGAFLQHHLTDPGGDLWQAGDSGTDFTNVGVKYFTLEAGDGDLVSLDTIWETLWTQGDFYDTADTVVQMDQFLEFWSWRIITGGSDAYPYELDDFYIYADPSAGNRIAFAPWDMGKGWDNQMIWSKMSGVLAAKCYNDVVCQQDLKARVADDLDVYDVADVPGFASEMNKLTDDAVYAETRREVPYTSVSSARTTLSYSLSNQVLRVKQTMGLH